MANPQYPTAFFAYNRPEHALRALSALAANPEAVSGELFIYCDGPKTDADLDAVSATRAVVQSRPWFRRTHVVLRDTNLGLAGSITRGVDEILAVHDGVVVVEDDLVVAPSFLNFMNLGLRRYRDEKRVMQISGYRHPAPPPEKTEAYFLPLTCSWGWATWKDRWQYRDRELAGYRMLKQDEELIWRFNLDGTYPLYYRFIERQLRGEIDSWAIGWYLGVFMRGGLTLYPSWSLVSNVGFDGSGRHCVVEDAIFDSAVVDRMIGELPDAIEVNTEAWGSLKQYMNLKYKE
ncbi:glycosyltransferase [Fundidesulfovibrio terrae]|uniref:glycosyltransferase n=1 Tax=Fundidesulfovibrio terrae TaxID=2922866 RepID=UPI001FAF6F44